LFYYIIILSSSPIKFKVSVKSADTEIEWATEVA